MGAVRTTIQQKLVLDALGGLCNHPTVDQVYIKVQQIYPNISKATVYRNLKQLAEEGKILWVDLPGSPERYDHRVSPHYHFQCRECEKILDIEAKSYDELLDQAKIPKGFFVESHDLFIKGLCANCQRKK